MKRVSNITSIIASVLILLGLPLYVSAQSTINKQEKNNQVAVNSEQNAPNGIGSRGRKMNDEQKKVEFKRWAEQNLKFYKTKEDVEKELPFKFKLPKENIGELKGIYVSKNTPNTEISTYYIDEVSGISIHIVQSQIKPDFKESVKQMKNEFAADYSKGNALPENIEINGLEGWGLEPGYNIIRGNQEPRPGFVEWYDNGLRYTIFGTYGEQGTSLHELLKIAKSMY